MKDVLDADDGTSLVVDAVHKKDALSVVSDVYSQLHRLFRMVRKHGEDFREFEARFNAQLHRFYALGHLTALSEAVSALCLLNNSDFENSQRILILDVDAPSDGNLSPQSSTDQFIASVRYESVASVLCMCDVPKNSHSGSHSSHSQPQQALVAYQPKREQRQQQQPQHQQ